MRFRKQKNKALLEFYYSDNGKRLKEFVSQYYYYKFLLVLNNISALNGEALTALIAVSEH